jgi:quinol---cytochrome c reductase iron-sulfur subunit, bacillus type
MNDRTTSSVRGDRRGFCKEVAALVVGAVASLVPFCAGLLTFLDPLRRKTGGGGGFVLVTSVSALADDGSPRRFSIIADREDAWNKFPRVPVGAVYLRRDGDQVHALNVTCPHAGCPVEFKSGTGSYLCPCHESKFHLDGTLADTRSPSPRGMDALAAEVRNGTEVWVRFQNFEPGKARQVPLA